MKKIFLILFTSMSLTSSPISNLIVLMQKYNDKIYSKLINTKTANLGYYFLGGCVSYYYIEQKNISKAKATTFKQYVTENPELYEYTKKILSQLSPNNSINVIVNYPEEDLQRWCTGNYGKEDFVFTPLFKTTDLENTFFIGHELAHINHKDNLTSQTISHFCHNSYMICSIALLQSILAKRFYRAGLYGSLIALKFPTICHNAYSRVVEKRADLTAAQLINDPTIIRSGAQYFYPYDNFEQLKNDYNNYKNHPANYLKQNYLPGYNTYLRYLQNRTHPLNIERAWYLEQFAQKLDKYHKQP